MVTYDLNTTEATTMKDFNGGNGGMVGDVLLTFEVAATTSIEKGEIVRLSSGYLTNMSATSDIPCGVAMNAADNTSGAAGDLEVSVLVRGIAKVNAFVAESGNYDDALVAFTRCGLADDSVNVAGSCVACGADPTVYIGTMLSTHAVPAAADQLVLALVYVDLLGSSRAI